MRRNGPWYSGSALYVDRAVCVRGTFIHGRIRGPEARRHRQRHSAESTMATGLNGYAGAVIKAEGLERSRAAKEQRISRKEAMILNMEERMKENNGTSWKGGPRGMSGNEIQEYQEEIERLREQIDWIRESMAGVDRELERLEAEAERIEEGQEEQVEERRVGRLERMNECRKGIKAAKGRMQRDGAISNRLEEELQALSRQSAAERVRHKVKVIE